MIMKNVKKIKALLRFTFLSVLLMVAGCGTGEDLVPSANVLVQLTDAGFVPYQVSQMRVVIQRPGGPELSGVTNAQGIATINVDSPGTYSVLRVTGVDATSLAEGSQAGREFKKESPMVDPYPRLTFTYSFNPTAVVTLLGHDYNVPAPVPVIYKVTVLKVGNATSNTNGISSVTAGTGSFAGRVILTNLNFNDNTGAIILDSSDANANRLILYPNVTAGHPTPEFRYTIFFSDVIGTDLGFTNSYTQAGPIYFEAPGTDSGDWALGYNLSATDLKNRTAAGGADQTRNFPGFNGGSGNLMLRTVSTSGSGSTGHAYSLNYRIFKFDAY